MLTQFALLIAAVFLVSLAARATSSLDENGASDSQRQEHNTNIIKGTTDEMILALNDMPPSTECNICSITQSEGGDRRRRSVSCHHIEPSNSALLKTRAGDEWNITCNAYAEEAVSALAGKNSQLLMDQYRGRLEVIAGQHKYRLSDHIESHWANQRQSSDDNKDNYTPEDREEEMVRMLNILHPKKKRENEKENSSRTRRDKPVERKEEIGFLRKCSSLEASDHHPVIYVKAPDKSICNRSGGSDPSPSPEVTAFLDSIRMAASRLSVALCLCGGAYNTSSTFTLAEPSSEVPRVLGSRDCGCEGREDVSLGYHYIVECKMDASSVDDTVRVGGSSAEVVSDGCPPKITSSSSSSSPSSTEDEAKDSSDPWEGQDLSFLEWRGAMSVVSEEDDQRLPSSTHTHRESPSQPVSERRRHTIIVHPPLLGREGDGMPLNRRLMLWRSLVDRFGVGDASLVMGRIYDRSIFEDVRDLTKSIDALSDSKTISFRTACGPSKAMLSPKEAYQEWFSGPCPYITQPSSTSLTDTLTVRLYAQVVVSDSETEAATNYVKRNASGFVHETLRVPSLNDRQFTVLDLVDSFCSGKRVLRAATDIDVSLEGGSRIDWVHGCFAPEAEIDRTFSSSEDSSGSVMRDLSASLARSLHERMAAVLQTDIIGKFIKPVDKKRSNANANDDDDDDDIIAKAGNLGVQSIPVRCDFELDPLSLRTDNVRLSDCSLSWMTSSFGSVERGIGADFVELVGFLKGPFEQSESERHKSAIHHLISWDV